MAARPDLAHEPDFSLGSLRLSPSTCRAVANGSDIKVEAQTMIALIVLVRAAGATVSRDDLIDVCWQGRIVSDDAIARTIAKVRALSRGIDPAPFILETLPKVGYRLRADQKAAAAGSEGSLPDEQASSQARTKPGGRKLLAAAVAMVVAGAVAIPLGWYVLPGGAAPRQNVPPASLPTVNQMKEALRVLDKARIHGYLDRGWDPNWHLDAEGNASLQILFEACENKAHDKQMLVQIARLLVIGGANPLARDKWDDSPLDTAISPRYCGPTHPVTEYLRSIVPPVEIRRVYERACAEAFGGRRTKANWPGSGLTREACAEAAQVEDDVAVGKWKDPQTAPPATEDAKRRP
jgi:DNA-binding winged helix-turn-helix (wHTH) protein